MTATSPAITGAGQRRGQVTRKGGRRSGLGPPAQTPQFLRRVRGHRLSLLFRLVALPGLRRGEAAGLQWSDLELDAGTLRDVDGSRPGQPFTLTPNVLDTSGSLISDIHLRADPRRRRTMLRP